MAGHSKWNNIKNRKGAQDKARAKVFNDISKLIRIAVKTSGSGDPKSNPSLRLLMDKARQANMPNDKIQKAIDAGLGRGKGGAIQEIIYEGFAPGGVGMLVIAQTDNPNRTAGEVRSIISKKGGNLAGPNAAMFLFQRQGDTYQAAMPMEITDAQTISQLEELVEDLEASDDVEEVFMAATWASTQEE